MPTNQLVIWVVGLRWYDGMARLMTKKCRIFSKKSRKFVWNACKWLISPFLAVKRFYTYVFIARIDNHESCAATVFNYDANLLELRWQLTWSTTPTYFDYVGNWLGLRWQSPRKKRWLTNVNILPDMSVLFRVFRWWCEENFVPLQTI